MYSRNFYSLLRLLRIFILEDNRFLSYPSIFKQALILLSILSLSCCTQYDDSVVGQYLPSQLEKNNYSFEIEDTIYHVSQFKVPDTLERHIASSHYLNERAESFHLYKNGLIAFDGVSVRNIPIEKQHISELTVDLLPLRKNLIGIVKKKAGMIGSERELHLLDIASGKYMSHQKIFQHTPLADKKISHYFSTTDGILHIGADNQGIYTLDHYEISKIPRTKDFYLMGVSDTLLVAGKRAGKGFERLCIMNRKGVTVSSLTLESPDLQKIALTQEYLYLTRKKDKTVYCFPIKNGVFKKPWGKGVQVPVDFSFKFKSQRGLVFYRAVDKTFAVIHKDSFYQSNYLSILENSIRPEELHKALLYVASTSQHWYVTPKSLVSVRKVPAGKKKSKLFCKQIQGFSSRNLSFIGDSQLIASSYDGLKEINLSHLPDSLDVNTLNSKITECITGYPVYYYRDSIIEIAINGKGGHYAPIHTDSCSFLESPLPYRTELYGFQPIGLHHYLVGGKLGLYMSKLSNTSVTVKVVIKEGKDTIQSLSVNRIKKTEDSDILVICALEGLYLCRWDSSGTYLDLIHKYTEANVNDALILPDKSIMIATRHRGMLWLDSAPNFTLRYAFNLTNHFSSMVANNILSDDSGRVWISTNSGLYLIDLSAQRVFDFKDIPELSEQEFNHLSSAKNSAGLLAFGGVDGVTFVDPKTMPALEYNEWDTVEIKGFHSYGKGRSSWDFYRQNEKFKVDYGIEGVKPIAQYSLFDGAFKLFYKPTNKSYVFWQEAKNGAIPLDKLKGHKEMSVLWESPDGSRHYSAFKYKISSGYDLYYPALGIPFILIFALIFFLNSRQYSTTKKTNNIERISLQEEKVAASPDEQVGSKTEPLPRATQEDLLESYLAQLKERENEVCIIPYNLSSMLLEQVTEIVIREMSSKDFSVDQVAVEVNLSSRQLHRKLIELTGLTPNKYFVFIKMQKAKEMMIKNIDLRVGEVATAVGYSNASYFSKVFIKIYKVKPTEMMEDIKQIWQSGL